jgi:hypothetical protein
MMNKLIYTLYLISRRRNLGDDYLMSGGFAFILLWFNGLTLLTLICYIGKRDMVSFFVENEIVILTITILGLGWVQFYARKLVKRMEQSGNNNFREIPAIGIVGYGIASVLLFFMGILFLRYDGSANNGAVPKSLFAQSQAVKYQGDCEPLSK